MALGVGTHTHTYFSGIKVISRNQAHANLQLACAWFKNYYVDLLALMKITFIYAGAELMSFKSKKGKGKVLTYSVCI